MRFVLPCALAATLAVIDGGALSAQEQPPAGPDRPDCRRFLRKTGGRGLHETEAPSFLACVRAFRQDVLWLKDEIESGTRKQKEKLQRAERITRMLVDIDRLKVEVDGAAAGPTRDAAFARLKAAFETLAVDLGLAAGTLAPVDPRAQQTTRVREAMASFQSEGRPEGRQRFASELSALLAASVVPTVPPAPTQGWNVILPGRWVQETTPQGERALAPDHRVEYLLRAHDAYDRLKILARGADQACTPTPSPGAAGAACLREDGTEATRVEDAVSELQGVLHLVMDELGLRRPMTGLLIQALGFTRASADGKKSEDQAAQLAVVKVETRHWSLRDIKDSWTDDIDFGALGHFGVHPAFNMFLPEPQTRSLETTTIERTVGDDGTTREVTTVEGRSRRVCVTPPLGQTACDPNTEPTLKPRFETALGWSLGVRGGIKVGEIAEVSAVMRYGQVFTQPKAATIEATDKAPAAGSLLDATAGSRHFVEKGVRASLFGGTRGLKGHHDLGILRPLLEVEVGQRNDARFRRAFTRPEDVEAFGEHPERRYYLRVALSGLEVFGRDTPFELSLGVEREWKRESKGLPEGTKVFVQGRLDVFGLVSGPKKPEK